MIDTIRSEWIKFRSVRSNLILLTIGGVLTVTFAVLISNQIADEQRVFNLTDVSAGSGIAVYLFGALGVQIIGQEYRFNTIRSTFAATPNRFRVFAAKAVVAVAAVAVMAVLMQLVALAIGSVMLDPFEFDGIDQRAFVGTVVFSVGWTLAGLALGAILRQPIAGIIILLVEGAIVEGIVIAIFDRAVPWMPYLNGSRMMVRMDDPHPDDVMHGMRSVVGGGVYFFIVVAVLLAIGAILVNRRDA